MVFFSRVFFVFGDLVAFGSLVLIRGSVNGSED